MLQPAFISSDPPVRKLNASERKIVTEMFLDAKDSRDFELAAWVELMAANLACDESEIRKVVAKTNKAFDVHRRLAAVTVIQREADTVGACVMSALDTLKNSLSATKKQLLVDRDRSPILNQNGQFQFIETPDWAARVRGASIILDVHGGKAPREVNVSGKIEHDHFINKSDDELKARLSAAMETIEKNKFIEIEAVPVKIEGEKP